MNLEEKVDAILAAVQSPATTTTPSVDLTPVLAAIAALDAKVTDIQGEVDEPAAPAPAPAPAPASA